LIALCCTANADMCVKMVVGRLAKIGLVMAAPWQGKSFLDSLKKRPISCINIVDTEKTMRVTVKKWGNSASVRIPAAVMDAAKVRLDQTVDVREERGRIVIEPVREPAFDIDTLVSAITNENRHGEIDSGSPVGREVL
jgi:antitoxin MazE